MRALIFLSLVVLATANPLQRYLSHNNILLPRLNALARARARARLHSLVGSNSIEPCSSDEIRNYDGSCRRPTVTRNIFAFIAPEVTPIVKPPSHIPDPEVDLNIVFVKAPSAEALSNPLIVPPAQQKTLIYVLNKNPVFEQEVIEVPSAGPADPEVFFINYSPGENPTLPGGIDLQTALAQGSQANQGGFITNDFAGGYTEPNHGYIEPQYAEDSNTGYSIQQKSYLPASIQQQKSYLPAPIQQQRYLPASIQQQNSYLPVPIQQQSYFPASSHQQGYLPTSIQHLPAQNYFKKPSFGNRNTAQFGYKNLPTFAPKPNKIINSGLVHSQSNYKKFIPAYAPSLQTYKQPILSKFSGGYKVQPTEKPFIITNDQSQVDDSSRSEEFSVKQLSAGYERIQPTARPISTNYEILPIESSAESKEFSIKKLTAGYQRIPPTIEPVVATYNEPIIDSRSKESTVTQLTAGYERIQPIEQTVQQKSVERSISDNSQSDEFTVQKLTAGYEKIQPAAQPTIITQTKSSSIEKLISAEGASSEGLQIRQLSGGFIGKNPVYNNQKSSASIETVPQYFVKRESGSVGQKAIMSKLSASQPTTITTQSQTDNVFQPIRLTAVRLQGGSTGNRGYRSSFMPDVSPDFPSIANLFSEI